MYTRFVRVERTIIHGRPGHQYCNCSERVQMHVSLRKEGNPQLNPHKSWALKVRKPRRPVDSVGSMSHAITCLGCQMFFRLWPTNHLGPLEMVTGQTWRTCY